MYVTQLARNTIKSKESERQGKNVNNKISSYSRWNPLQNGRAAPFETNNNRRKNEISFFLCFMFTHSTHNIEGVAPVIRIRWNGEGRTFGTCHYRLPEKFSSAYAFSLAAAVSELEERELRTTMRICLS